VERVQESESAVARPAAPALSRTPVLGGDSLRLSFLVRAGDLLAASLDDDRMLAGLARFSVPEFADHCVAYSIGEDGVPRLSAIAGPDAETEDVIRRLAGVAPTGSFSMRSLEGAVVFQPRLDSAALARQDPSFRETLVRLGIRSVVAVPLVAHGQVLGALTFSQSVSERLFEPEDAALAEELGKRAGLALVSTRLLRREQEARRRLELLATASGIVADAAHDAASMTRQIVELLAERLGDDCSLRLLGPDGITLERVAGHHRDPEAAALARTLLSQNRQRRDEGLAARVFAAGEPVQLGPMTDEEALARLPSWYTPFLRRFGCSCLLYVPVRTRGRIDGILALARDRGRSVYSSHDREAVQQIADRMASALESLRLYEAEQAGRRRSEQAADQTQRLHKLATALSSALEQRQIAQVVVDEGVQALQARAGVMALLDEEMSELSMLATRGYPAAIVERWQRFPLSSHMPLAEVVRTGNAVFVGSLAELDRRYPGQSVALRDLGDEALFAAPLRFEGRVLGALGMTFRRAREFSWEDRALVEALAAQCAQALERARLYEAELRSRARFGFIAEAASILTSSLDYRTTLSNVARLLVPGFADWCSVELLEDGVPTQVAVAHADPEKVALARELRERYPPQADDPGGIYDTLRTSEARLYREIPDAVLVAATRHPEHLRILRELGLRSAIAVPLVARGRTLGSLILVSTREGRRYGASDLATAQELARHSAAAVDNARLFREVQQAVSIRDVFLSVAGHELRTPLTALKLQLQLVERLAKADGPVDLLRVAAAGTSAVRQADRLERLINELLDVSRIVAGKVRLDFQEVDLAALAREVADRFGEELARAGCTLRFEAGENVVGRWDPARLDQVLTNLLGNAIKYGKGSALEVTVERLGGEARLSVRDHGIGIAPEHQARIFGRFERAVSERHYGGLGLGLWIAREVVDSLGGSIRCESGLGQGSTFTVVLPLQRAPLPG
jgi:signal transduction histidine kinase